MLATVFVDGEIGKRGERWMIVACVNGHAEGGGGLQAASILDQQNDVGGAGLIELGREQKRALAARTGEHDSAGVDHNRVRGRH